MFITAVCLLFLYINPLAPVPPVTGHDKPCLFFHFWRHHFWPKLVSFILNFCRRKRSFQWCPDQSYRLNGAWDMHINAQKDEWKTQGKTSCHYTWLLRCNLKLAASMTLSYKYFNRKQAQQKVNHCTKKKRKEEKGKGKNRLALDFFSPGECFSCCFNVDTVWLLLGFFLRISGSAWLKLDCLIDHTWKEQKHRSSGTKHSL